VVGGIPSGAVHSYPTKAVRPQTPNLKDLDSLQSLNLPQLVLLSSPNHLALELDSTPTPNYLQLALESLLSLNCLGLDLRQLDWTSGGWTALLLQLILLRLSIHQLLFTAPVRITALLFDSGKVLHRSHTLVVHKTPLCLAPPVPAVC
jgi:hypothetical protein